MLSPEVKLLILGSRIKLNPSQKSEFKQILNKDLDWHELLKRAQKENVSPLLYRNLKVYEDKVPDEIVSQLNRIYITNFGRNLRRTTYLHQTMCSTIQVFHSSLKMLFPNLPQPEYLPKQHFHNSEHEC